MFELRLKRTHLLIFGFALLGFMLALFYSTYKDPEQVKAGGAPQGTCSISAWQNGSNPLSRGFSMSISTPDGSVGSAGPDYLGQNSPWIPYMRNWGVNYYHTYSSDGNKTVYGRFHYKPQGSSSQVDVQCSRTITIVAPNSQALAWVTNISCSAAGALTFTANVADADGGTPGYYLSIQNVGDTGWIYQPSGSYGMGPYSPPRDGGTYSISIWAADAQTGGVVGPGVYYYSCPVPPAPPTCSLSVNPALVPPNGSSTLSWSSANATTFTVDQGVGSLSPVAGGSRVVLPGLTTKTYTGTVSGPGGSANCSTTLSVGTVSCSLNSILSIEPGDTYTPAVSLNYVGAAATFSATTTVTTNGVTRVNVLPAAAVPANYSTTVTVGPAVTFLVAGDFPVTSTTSGTVNGAAYGPIDCNTSGLVVSVARKPYFKVFGGGAAVGAGFNIGTTTCSPVATGQVSGFASSSPSLHGASTQYDLKALRSVATTFYSSGANPSGIPTFKALTLANDLTSGTYGGNFGSSDCITDYYSTTKNDNIPSASGAASIGSLDIAAGAGDQVEWGGGTLSGGSLSTSQRLLVYVDGDVYITGNITLASSYNTLSDIPVFTLVVKGNIMIAPGVTVLDGIYISQPDGATGGTIFTCATSATTIPTSSALYATCSSKLTFNGIVVAKNIKLLRTNGTLRDGPANEAAGSSNIAEVFNGLPELFMAEQGFSIDESDAELYDSITSLPPLL